MEQNKYFLSIKRDYDSCQCPQWDDSMTLQTLDKIVRSASWQQKFCPKCVNDEAYKRINAMMDRNEVKPSSY